MNNSEYNKDYYKKNKEVLLKKRKEKRRQKALSEGRIYKERGKLLSAEEKQKKRLYENTEIITFSAKKEDAAKYRELSKKLGKSLSSIIREELNRLYDENF